MIKINTYKFISEDVEIEVPFDNEVYLNATDVYQKFGKSKTGFDSWKTRTLIPYAEKLIQMKKVSPQNEDLQTIDGLIVSRRGNSSSSKAGTWLHPKLAIVFARWLSIEFEIWCDEKIAELLSVGITTMNAEDMQYADFLYSIGDHCTASSKTFSRIIKKMLTLHEASGYNIKKFDELLASVSKNSDKVARLKLYEKIASVIEEMYQTGDLDITTRESMRKRCDLKRNMLMKTRITKAENKLSKISFTLKPAPSDDKDTHDEIVAINLELAKTKAELESTRAAVLGVVEQPKDGKIALFTLDETDIVVSLRDLINNAVDFGYKILFSSFLVPVDPIEGKKLPTASGEYVIPGKGRIGAAVWTYYNTVYMRLSKYGVDGRAYPVLELTLWQSKENPNEYSSDNKAHNIRAVFNEPTNCLAVYALPPSKN